MIPCVVVIMEKLRARLLVASTPRVVGQAHRTSPTAAASSCSATSRSASAACCFCFSRPMSREVAGQVLLVRWLLHLCAATRGCCIRRLLQDQLSVGLESLRSLRCDLAAARQRWLGFGVCRLHVGDMSSLELSALVQLHAATRRAGISQRKDAGLLAHTRVAESCGD